MRMVMIQAERQRNVGVGWQHGRGGALALRLSISGFGRIGFDLAGAPRSREGP